jgi:uncharacterized protein (TIGR00369 family)
MDKVDLAAHGWNRHEVSGFSNLVGPFWSRSDAGARGYAFVAEERHLNGNGIVHGGILMTFVDQAIGMTVWDAIDRRPCATIQLNTHFVDSGRAGELIEARAEIVRQTRSVIFTRAIVRTGTRTLLTADGIWKVLRADPAAEAPRWS